MMKIEASWAEKLKSEIGKPYVQELKAFLAREEKDGATVYPPQSLVFHALRQTPFNQVKVVIVGQDPYHGPGQAHGLSFSVPSGVPLPPSLRNIFQELHSDLGIVPVQDGCLNRWAEQGVLLLNATLTVQAGKPASHQGKGWEQFTDAIVRLLSEREDPLVFILWGKSAQEKCKTILQDRSPPHLILTAPHPSPFSAHTGFLGCRHFSKANAFLERSGKTPIIWGK